MGIHLTHYTAANTVILRRYGHNKLIDLERQQFFWSRVKRDGSHLIWTGSYASRNYGFMYFGTEKVYVHRVSYCMAKGLDLADIEGLNILRTCDRNDCAAPEHLVAKRKKLVS